MYGQFIVFLDILTGALKFALVGGVATFISVKIFLFIVGMIYGAMTAYEE